MRIRLTDERHLADLLAFMRTSGCIAYYEAAAESIEVVRPHAFLTYTEAGAIVGRSKRTITRWLQDPELRLIAERESAVPD